jgi:hypothetical protein
MGIAGCHMKIIKNIVGTQSTIEVGFVGSNLVARKVASQAGSEEVADQVNLIRALPPSIARHYPRLLEFELSNEGGWYLMPYYSYPTMRTLILNSSLSATTLFNALRGVINFVFNTHHEWRKEVAGEEYFLKTYIKRPITRLQSMEVKHQYFVDISKAERVVIGSEELQSPIKLLNDIWNNSTLVESIQPAFVCSTHGQVEFEHILINLSGDNQPEFILLDARGSNHLLDPAYDAGKLLQCTHGRIDWLEEDWFDLGQIEASSTVFAAEHLHFGFEDRLDVCRELHENVVAEIISAAKIVDPDIFRIQMKLAEAAHLLSAVPFCYRRNDLERALACFFVGTMALNDLVNNELSQF